MKRRIALLVAVALAGNSVYPVIPAKAGIQNSHWAPAPPDVRRTRLMCGGFAGATAGAFESEALAVMAETFPHRLSMHPEGLPFLPVMALHFVADASVFSSLLKDRPSEELPAAMSDYAAELAPLPILSPLLTTLESAFRDSSVLPEPLKPSRVRILRTLAFLHDENNAFLGILSPGQSHEKPATYFMHELLFYALERSPQMVAPLVRHYEWEWQALGRGLSAEEADAWALSQDPEFEAFVRAALPGRVSLEEASTLLGEQIEAENPRAKGVYPAILFEMPSRPNSQGRTILGLKTKKGKMVITVGSHLPGAYRLIRYEAPAGRYHMLIEYQDARPGTPREKVLFKTKTKSMATIAYWNYRDPMRILGRTLSAAQWGKWLRLPRMRIAGFSRWNFLTLKTSENTAGRDEYIYFKKRAPGWFWFESQQSRFASSAFAGDEIRETNHVLQKGGGFLPPLIIGHRRLGGPSDNFQKSFFSDPGTASLALRPTLPSDHPWSAFWRELNRLLLTGENPARAQQTHELLTRINRERLKVMVEQALSAVPSDIPMGTVWLALDPEAALLHATCILIHLLLPDLRESFDRGLRIFLRTPYTGGPADSRALAALTACCVETVILLASWPDMMRDYFVRVTWHRERGAVSNLRARYSFLRSAIGFFYRYHASVSQKPFLLTGLRWHIGNLLSGHAAAENISIYGPISHRLFAFLAMSGLSIDGLPTMDFRILAESHPLDRALGRDLIAVLQRIDPHGAWALENDRIPVSGLNVIKVGALTIELEAALAALEPTGLSLAILYWGMDIFIDRVLQLGVILRRDLIRQKLAAAQRNLRRDLQAPQVEIRNHSVPADLSDLFLKKAFDQTAWIVYFSLPEFEFLPPIIDQMTRDAVFRGKILLHLLPNGWTLEQFRNETDADLLRQMKEESSYPQEALRLRRLIADTLAAIGSTQTPDGAVKEEIEAQRRRLREIRPKTVAEPPPVPEPQRVREELAAAIGLGWRMSDIAKAAHVTGLRLTRCLFNTMEANTSWSAIHEVLGTFLARGSAPLRRGEKDQRTLRGALAKAIVDGQSLETLAATCQLTVQTFRNFLTKSLNLKPASQQKLEAALARSLNHAA